MIENWRMLARSGIQSSAIMILADSVTQTTTCLEQSSGSSSTSVPSQFDGTRSLRWGLCGLLLHGPYFYVGFNCLDGVFGAAKGMSTVLRKTIAAQIVLFPPYLGLLFGFMGYMENSDDILGKIQRQVPDAFAAGCLYWPLVNVLNFTYVSPAYRVSYVATCAGFWNAFLSWSNACEKKSTTKEDVNAD